MEWRMRAKLLTGKVLVGGYVNCVDQTLYLADEFSGEVHEVPVWAVDSFDVKKYSSLPSR